MSVVLTPTIHFQGKCREALKLYAQAFDLRVDFALRYRDAKKEDWDVDLSEEEKEYVYHAEGYIGGQRLMFADDLAGKPPQGCPPFLTVTFDTATEVERAYEALREGATILVPMHSTTYSSCMGSLIDRFGVRWGLMTEQTER